MSVSNFSSYLLKLKQLPSSVGMGPVKSLFAKYTAISTKCWKCSKQRNQNLSKKIATSVTRMIRKTDPTHTPEMSLCTYNIAAFSCSQSMN